MSMVWCLTPFCATISMSPEFERLEASCDLPHPNPQFNMFPYLGVSSPISAARRLCSHMPVSILCRAVCGFKPMHPGEGDSPVFSAMAALSQFSRELGESIEGDNAIHSRCMTLACLDLTAFIFFFCRGWIMQSGGCAGQPSIRMTTHPPRTCSERQHLCAFLGIGCGLHTLNFVCWCRKVVRVKMFSRRIDTR